MALRFTICSRKSRSLADDSLSSNSIDRPTDELTTYVAMPELFGSLWYVLVGQVFTLLMSEL